MQKGPIYFAFMGSIQLELFLVAIVQFLTCHKLVFLQPTGTFLNLLSKIIQYQSVHWP